MKENRIVFVDYLRVVACFLVMLVHASENFYAADASGLAGNVSMLVNEQNRFWVAFYDGTLGRISVPLFMLASAFLLVPLKPGVRMVDFYKRRFKRVLTPMIVFMLLYTFLPLLWGQMTWEQSWTDFTMLPFTFPSMVMYPLISLYLIMPVVSPWLERASARDERLFLCIFAISTLIPWLVRFVSSDLWGTCFWNPYFGMFYYCSGYLGYLVMAHYIRFHLSWDRGKKLRIGTICLLVGAAFTGWSFWHAGLPGKMIETPMLEWSWESCIKQQQAPRWITSLSKLSFGMYLMHLFFLSNIAPIFVAGDQSNPLVPVWLAIPCIALLTFLCCAITTKIVSYVPGSKWIIG